MPDSHRDLIAGYRSQISLLEKALLREKRSKKRLEEKLDQKKQNNFVENKEIMDAFDKASTRQLQFQFLSRLTQELLSNKKTHEIVDNFIFTLAEFMENCPVIQMYHQVNTDREISMMDKESKQWMPLPWLNVYDDLFDKMLSQEEYYWHRVEHENDVTNLLKPYVKNTTLLYLVNHESNLQKRIIILDIKHFCYTKDFKQTLNIAGKQFSLAIKKRVAERELSCNYDVLKNILVDLENTQAQLVHSEKMASIGQLAAGIAHEINNPVGYISSNLNVLVDYAEIFEKSFLALSKTHQVELSTNTELVYARADLPELVEACLNGVKRVSEIVTSLKVFSRKEKDTFTEVDVNAVVQSSLKMVWNHLKYDHQVIENLSSLPLYINGNWGQLQQVFVNLFVNAAQAMPTNGSLTITSQKLNNHIEITVKDTGQGISPENLTRIFEPFYTSKNENEGTGLGLSVSYAIIEKHKASIDVESTLNVGTLFILKFPLYKQAGVPEAAS